MKQLLVLSNVLLLLSTCDAAAFMSPSESPVSSPSEPSNNDCSTVVYGMFDCLSFLTVGSTDLSPTKTCCEGVKIVLEYNSSCLCVALESSRAMGFDLINNRALAMPSTCNIPIDPHCDLDHVIFSSHSSFLGVNRHMKKSKTKKRCGGGGLENKKERCEETLK
ncbi:hypothetical protein Bca52824_081222 [Brassica carinata]|uniref:Bifunctional inhibitor/plant lipid transfer protein/seed storage helical domain-containing protein n=1 Tax=Brassica carinata TaxID=52824 RepID=A0A8X7TRP9_BRACI|nr:hypothetical protein Bca52824_081222 [Brassica carinata]